MNEISEELKEMGSRLASVPRSMPFAVPEGYFEGLTADIYSTVTAQVDKVNMPMGQVPEGYFEQLPQQILMAAKKADKPSIIITLTGHIRWAAAAILIICMGLGSYITFVDRPANSPETLLSSVSASDIHAYLQAGYRPVTDHASKSVHVDELQVGHKEIEQYLNETGWE